MTETVTGCCVLLPCAPEFSWVIPQACLGEIVTVPSTEELPPRVINWRGETVPVMDIGGQDAGQWRDQRGGAGLVAVLLGQRDEACRYFGLAVRGVNLGVSNLAREQIEDLDEPLSDYATAAFRMNEQTYQIPDLLALQRALASREVVAQ
jgi:chemotaxis signal transduction protein